jgi:hypothetical protein
MTMMRQVAKVVDPEASSENVLSTLQRTPYCLNTRNFDRGRIRYFPDNPTIVRPSDEVCCAASSTNGNDRSYTVRKVVCRPKLALHLRVSPRWK